MILRLGCSDLDVLPLILAGLIRSCVQDILDSTCPNIPFSCYNAGRGN